MMLLQMVGVETIMTGIMDTWQSLVLHWQYRVLAVIGVCTVGFVLGIPCTTQVPSLCAYLADKAKWDSEIDTCKGLEWKIDGHLHREMTDEATANGLSFHASIIKP